MDRPLQNHVPQAGPAISLIMRGKQGHTVSPFESSEQMQNHRHALEYDVNHLLGTAVEVQISGHKRFVGLTLLTHLAKTPILILYCD